MAQTDAAIAKSTLTHTCRTPEEQAIRKRELALFAVGQQAGFSAAFWQNKRVQDEHQAICVMLFANSTANPSVEPPYPSLFSVIHLASLSVKK
jgi:hypothetical protein